MDISRTVEGIIETCLIVLLVFTPLARGAVQTWAVALAHFVTLVILTTYVWGVLFGAQPRPARTPLDLPLLALFLLAALSSSFSIEQHSSVGALVRLAHYLVLYVVVANTVRRRDQVRRLACMVVAVGGFLALFGLIKYLGELSPPWWDYEVSSNGLTATFANRNHLAGYMEMAMAVAIGLFTAARKGWQKALCAFFIFCQCVALTLSLSRGGWLSAILALGFMLCLYVVKTKQSYRALMVSVVAVATVVVLTALASTPVIERLETLTPGERMGHRQGRPAVWAKTVDLIKDHPLLGTGPGTFAVAFTPYRPAGLNATYAYAHNDYLHFVAETGLLTLGVLLWLVAAAFYTAIGRLRTTKSRLTLGITLGALAGMVAILAHSMVDFNLHIMANATLFTVLAGLVMSAARGPWTSSRSPLRPQPLALKSISFPKAVAALSTFGLFAWGTCWLFGMFMGDYYISQAQAIEKTRDWNTAMSAYEKALHYGPGNPAYPYLFGKFYLTFAKAAKEAAIKEMLLQRAWGALEEARKGSPHHAGTYLALAQTAEALGQLGRSASKGDAERLYQRAVAFYPNSAPYRYALAGHYKRVGADNKALEHLETMLTLDPRTDRYIRHHVFWEIPNIDAAAERALKKALENPFTRFAAVTALAARMAEKKKWLEAARVYDQRVPESAFEDRSGHDIQMGHYLLMGGRDKEAEARFLRALEGTQDLAAALKRVTRAYQKAEKLAQLAFLLETAKRRRPERVEIDLYWAQVLYEQGQYQEAFIHLDAFLKGKETAEADFWMAKTLKALGEDYRAEAAIKQAIRWEPEKALFRHFYAGLLYDQWRFSEALRQAEAAVRLSQGNNAWHLDRKAWILYRMKRYEASIETWQRAVGLKPGYKAFYRNIDRAAKDVARPPP
ncbi:MAG: O-antigen ligase family protein [Thermodesulfobacteriota bacterium]|nr:O-antigen ligase family protein [Thermodesulfobacteriota bacterium]